MNVRILSRVDGFDQDHGTGESDDCAVTGRRLLAAECDALEALELAHGLLDAGTSLVEQLGK